MGMRKGENNIKRSAIIIVNEVKPMINYVRAYRTPINHKIKRKKLVLIVNIIYNCNIVST